ncbi:unnamed protein product [Caenorhabditis nigoni]
MAKNEEDGTEAGENPTNESPLDNNEILEKLKMVVAETEEIKNSHKRKFDEIAEKLQSIEESVSKIPKIEEKPKSEKRCVLKYVFENLANLKEGGWKKSGKEQHFNNKNNSKWRMGVLRNESHLELILCCRPIGFSGNQWSIETKLVFRTMGNDYESVKKISKYSFEPNGFFKLDNFLEWNDINNYLIDNNLTVEVEVEILKMTGFGKANQWQSFQILFPLSLQSSYFKTLFSGKFNESQKNEIELKDINPDDFQNFLELIHGESSIDDDTVSGILNLADMYDVSTAIKKCQEFLLEKSKKNLKKKLQLATRYNLEKLKEKCMSEIKTVEDIRSVIPNSINDLDHQTTLDLLAKSISFH